MAPNLGHLPRYGELVAFFWKHGGSELFDAKRFADEIPDLEIEDGDDDKADPESLAEDLEKLGPTYIKIGQLLSTRPDLLPPAYLEALERLQDDVEPFPYAEVEEIVERELGVRISKAFGSFESEPMASASLAQVHRATLRDGRPVAVKVQRPGCRKQVLEDLDMLEKLSSFVADRWDSIDVEALVADMRTTLMRELDYTREAAHMRRLADDIREHRLVIVPKAVPDYSTSRVLTMQLVKGWKITELNPVTLIDIDGEALAEDLFRAYLDQVLVHGFFHADPHPGNVLLTEDHRICLLDLGMVAELTAGFREKLLRLLVAASEGNAEEAASAALRLGNPRENFDEAEFRQRASRLVMRLADRTVEQLQIGTMVLEVARTAAACGIQMPREFSMLGKTLLNLDQIAVTLAPDFDPNASIRDYASEVARRQMMRMWTPSAWLARLMELKDLTEALPKRLNQLLDSVSESGGIRLEVEAIDERMLINGFEKIANRITAGLVLAALIVGAALIMRIPTTWTLFGYPALAIVLFLLAAFGGGILVWNVIRSDIGHKPRRS